MGKPVDHLGMGIAACILGAAFCMGMLAGSIIPGLMPYVFPICMGAVSALGLRFMWLSAKADLKTDKGDDK